ncbi:Scy1p [Saccharomyces cerevisiae x Saccharomyces kudriavzevii VIN7]|uniref:Scy1p n=1 Tax=Saccharomyces cerevisiae x Saccharomyces kudriavzevii (strain VIN7) TaxID=1095631 RepID=H0GUS5_SACCK|nr:Scy1p [Saccharomyces cerevisiae x Saccharomyces kudriavzevii VIN7]CAI5270155.1 AIS_HP2_G0018310.mRNA.1.CDS.1 [Saccharomyces cerevisiae]CAI6507421.1 AIS_HP2_G0018310.mRNA.1.CDS.1 [Saccharomyces cerevisiae]
MMFWSSRTGITSKYSFSSSPTFTAEPWSVYTGRLKSSSSSSPSKVSIFMFDKKQFENYLLHYSIIKSKSGSKDKMLIQEAYEILRNQANNLAKLKHPNILTLIEPLEEHSKNFMFVTEFVAGSLETVFREIDDEEQNFLQGHVKDNIVVQRGILQVVNALDFIHNRASCVHLNIQPRAIFINENSDWKISGLGHLMKIPPGTNTSEYFLPQYDPRVPSFMHLQLNYTAPEIVFESTLAYRNDYYSLGLLIYFLYSGKDFFRSENSTTEYKSEYNKFQNKISTMSWDNIFSKIPPRLRHCMPKLMNRDIYSRYDNITLILSSDFFQDPLIKTLNFLDDLPTKNNEEKYVFLEGLINLLPEFPSALLQKKFLPILLELLSQFCAEKIVNDKCVNKNLDLIIKIGSTLSQLSFQEKIYPVLLSDTNFPILLGKATICLIDNLDTLKQKVKRSDFLENILKPLFSYVLHDSESDITVISQEKLLLQISLALEVLDFPTVKQFLLPLLSGLFTKTTSLTVKNTCLACFQIMIEHKSIDSYTCSETILPLFKSMKTRDRRILSRLLKLFETVPLIISDEMILVDQVLPLMWNYSMASTLTKSQYSGYTNAINKMSSDIQKHHIGKLNDRTNDDDEDAFHKVIEPAVVKKEDPETVAAKNIEVAAMKPIRKTTLPSYKSPSSPSKNVSSSKPLDPKGVLATRGFPMRTLNPPPRTTSNQTDTKVIREAASNGRSQTKIDDEFNEFQSFSSTGSVRQSRASSNIWTNTSISPAPTSTSNNNLPPGFSISLQPNKKKEGFTENRANNSYGSLI